jgi:uncharacterized protein
MSYPRYEIFKDNGGSFRFNLISVNYKVILVSEGYDSKQGCQAGIASCRENSPKDERYQRKTSVNNKYYFNLTAANGHIIGSSELYDNYAGRENGIDAVKRDGPIATVVDKT